MHGSIKTRDSAISDKLQLIGFSLLRCRLIPANSFAHAVYLPRNRPEYALEKLRERSVFILLWISDKFSEEYERFSQLLARLTFDICFIVSLRSDTRNMVLLNMKREYQ